MESHSTYTMLCGFIHSGQLFWVITGCVHSSLLLLLSNSPLNRCSAVYSIFCLSVDIRVVSSLRRSKYSCTEHVSTSLCMAMLSFLHVQNSRWTVCFFQYFKDAVYFLLTCIVPDERVSVILSLFLCTQSHLPLTACKFLLLILRKFIMCLVILFIFLVLGAHLVSWICGYQVRNI